MTHQQNYANDRLGSYAFVNLVKFIKCWTNLKLRWIEPKKMAEYYFKKNSQEKTLFYTVSIIKFPINFTIWTFRIFAWKNVIGECFQRIILVPIGNYQI